jgi:hypothetical protein
MSSLDLYLCVAFRVHRRGARLLHYLHIHLPADQRNGGRGSVSTAEG